MLTLITEPALQKLHANIKPKEENINLNLNQLPYTLMAKTGDNEFLLRSTLAFINYCEALSLTEVLGSNKIISEED